MPEEQLPETMNAVTAVNLALRGTEGPVYGPLTFTAPASGLTVLSGRGGSGRTALALTLAGRMASTTGEVTVLGETKRSKIRQMVAVAGVEQIDALDRDVTIRTALSEHLNWSRWWWTVPRRASQEYYEHLFVSHWHCTLRATSQFACLSWTIWSRFVSWMIACSSSRFSWNYRRLYR